MKSENTLYKVTLAFVVFFAVIFILDYFNAFSMINFSVNNFNYDVISIVIGNGVVIYLFFVAYFLIDKRRIEQEDNKRATALVVLKNIYLRCKEMVDLFENDFSRGKAVEKCNMDKVAAMDPMHSLYRNLPFDESSDIVATFSTSGILNYKEVEDYLDIKQCFFSYIDMSIVLHEPENHGAVNKIRDKLLIKLNDSLEQIEGELDEKIKKES